MWPPAGEMTRRDEERLGGQQLFHAYGRVVQNWRSRGASG